MQSPQTDQPTAKTASSVPVPQNWLLSLATTPLLITVLGTKTLHEMLLDLSSNSEEIFRGDRLPVLHFPPSEE